MINNCSYQMTSPSADLITNPLKQQHNKDEEVSSGGFAAAATAPIVLVIMGVTGSGKSTIGEMLAKKIQTTFLDADDFHPQSNIEKMRKGIPLTDEDRIPWLETLRDKLKDYVNGNKTVILGCSALQKRYRDILRSAAAQTLHQNGGSGGGVLKFACLEAPAEVIADRLKRRAEEGNHFMAVSLLQSQLDLLQIHDDDGTEKDVIVVDATPSPQLIVNYIHSKLF